MPALIIGAVPQSETGSANSFNTLMRSIGTSASAAVVGLILAHMTTHLGGYTVASLSGFRTGMTIGCGVAIVAAVVALAIPARRDVSTSPIAKTGRDIADREAAERSVRAD
jgi:galactitol-specific phosphotransferase system IIC component